MARRTKSTTPTSPDKMYFRQENEDAILEFNRETDQRKRELLFEEKIKRPLQKLSENVFNTFKFPYWEVGPLDAQKECLTHLMEQIHKFTEFKNDQELYEFDPELNVYCIDPKTKTRMKNKAFAYFSVVSKHFYIGINNKNYKNYQRHTTIDDCPSTQRELVTDCISNGKKGFLKEFIPLMITFWEKNIDKLFDKERDIVIANSVLELFRRSNFIEQFNKKAVYLYVREMTNCKTNHITRVVNKMQLWQKHILREFINTGIVSFDAPNK